MTDKNKGIYIHIPFCVKKCNYCDFNSYAGCFSKETAYFDALFSEIKIKGENFKNHSFDTVYIGGGTPTSVRTENIEELMKHIKKNFNMAEDAEITIECNPKTAKKEDFERCLRAGINRLSIGLQTTDDRLLETLGRIHKRKDFENCIKDAREAGFLNISLDLMYGLPDQSLKSFKETLKTASEYGTDHISCYALKVEEDTPFYNMKLNLPDDDLCADMYETAVEFLEECGYKRYEISNFSKPLKESRHNLKYWSGVSYIGLGAGAYSSVNSERYSNERKIDDYIEDVRRGKLKKLDYIKLSKEDEMSEYLFMGLRKIKGISISDFENTFNENVLEVFPKIEKHIKCGSIIRENDRIYINEKMLYISNGILCDFV